MQDAVLDNIDPSNILPGMVFSEAIVTPLCQQESSNTQTENEGLNANNELNIMPMRERLLGINGIPNADENELVEDENNLEEMDEQEVELDDWQEMA